MDGSISLSAVNRKALLHCVRRGSEPQLRLRAHILLLLADGHTWSIIAAVLFTSPATIDRWRRRCLDGDWTGVLNKPASRRRRGSAFFVAMVIRWVTLRSPTDFGFVRSRWTCGTIAVLLQERWQERVGRETIRRWLHQEDLVWRRPRPVLGPKDPARAAKLRKLRTLLAELPAAEVAVFQDEVQLDLNPKVGSAWMLKGCQAEVITPGDNVRRHLAVSVLAGTGNLVVSDPTRRRNSAQFVAHLADLCRRLRRWKVVHVICDNASFHKSKVVRRWVAKRGGGVVLHYLPSRAPEENPVEKVFWRLHEAVTRNHRFGTIEELVVAAVEWLEREGAAAPPVEDYSLAA